MSGITEIRIHQFYGTGDVTRLLALLAPLCVDIVRKTYTTADTPAWRALFGKSDSIVIQVGSTYARIEDLPEIDEGNVELLVWQLAASQKAEFNAGDFMTEAEAESAALAWEDTDD